MYARVAAVLDGLSQAVENSRVALIVGGSLSGAGFFVGTVVGLVASPAFGIEELSPSAEVLSVDDVFENNLTVALILFLGAILTYGTGNAVILGLNGFLVGQLVRVIAEGDALFSVVTGLLPHFFAELGGFIFASMAGAVLSHSLWGGVVKGDFGNICGKAIISAFFLFVGVLLVGVGAVIEVYWSVVPKSFGLSTCVVRISLV